MNRLNASINKKAEKGPVRVPMDSHTGDIPSGKLGVEILFRLFFLFTKYSTDKERSN